MTITFTRFKGILLIFIVNICVFTHPCIAKASEEFLLKGVIIDATSRNPIKAKLQWTSSSTGNAFWSKMIDTDIEGRFLISLKDKGIRLKIVCEGYSSTVLDLSFAQINTPDFFCQIPLVKLVDQQNNKVFSQSNTKYDKVNGTEIGAKAVEYTFTTINYITQQPIPADFKLVGTKNGKVINFSTNEQKQNFSIRFTESDIWAVEIHAQNYQPFFGSLIVNSQTARSHNDTISLIRTPAFLNIIASEESNVLLFKEKSKSQTNVPLKKNDQLYFSTLEQGEKYQIKIIRSKSDTVFYKFEANQLINQFVSHKSQATASVKLDISKLDNKNETFVLFFEQSDTKLIGDSKNVLEEAIAHAIANENTKIEIIGYTDNIGLPLQNKYLSEIRSMLVKNSFTAKGVSEKRIIDRAMGSRNPMSSNDNEDTRRKNRRVEIRLFSSKTD